MIPAGSSAPDGAAAHRGSTVLLVDDDPALRRVLEKILVRSGYRVLTAGSGPEALEVLRRHEGPVDAAVCDLLLPGMGGWALSGRLREARPNIPILFMSGYDLPTVLERGMVPAAMALRIPLLQKPFAAGDLTMRLQVLMAEAREAE